MRALVPILLLASLPALAAEHVVTQNNRQFSVDGKKAAILAVKAGDTVSFRNDDRFAHSVFSRTAGQEFDLGVMKSGAGGEKRFEKPGTVEVECALHPQMKFTVDVKP
jgi:plastocyanin